VWIEINRYERQRINHLLVTPLAGVWIEIVEYRLKADSKKVTPLAGVWIEIVTKKG